MAAAIAGRIYADPDRVIERDAQTMLSRLASRPGAAVERWVGRGAFLAQVGGPNSRRYESELRIVADVRLDERDSLASATRADITLSDAELILAADEKWGVDCLEHLRGDFAFALWDETTRTLFCARDIFGVAPFYYRNETDGLSFASQLGALWRPSDRRNANAIATYLGGVGDEPDQTAFLSIHRLPAGGWLRWRDGECVIGRYATLEPDGLPANENYALGLRERFLAAVDERSRHTSGLGAMLSGGLDSSSIVSAVAARGNSRLKTFSFQYRKASPYDEADYASAVLDKYALVPHFVALDDLAPLRGLADLASGPTDLLFAPGLPKIYRLLAAARQRGVRVMLDGHGGDEVISHGLGRLTSLARERRWRTLYRELRGISALSQQSAFGMFLTYFTHQGFAARLRNALVTGRADGTARAGSLLNREFVRTTDFEARAGDWQQTYARAAKREDTLHAWNVTSPAVARGFEALRVAADHAQVELRFPFYDRRVVSYALAVPESEKLKHGYTRHVLREAMEGILPEAVRWRRTKIDFGGELSDGMRRHHGDWLRDVLTQGSALDEYVDLAAARSLLERLQRKPREVSGSEVFGLWRVAFLAIWLKQLTETLSYTRDPVPA